MANERELQLECARIQQTIQQMETVLDGLRKSRDKILPLAEASKAKLIRQAEAEFEGKKRADKLVVENTCKSMEKRCEALLDSMPDLDAKEFAGRYEIKSLEDHLITLYPAEFVENYRCSNAQEFEDESDAYQVYTSAEHRVASMKQRNIASAIFTGLTNLMTNASEVGGMGAKVGLIAVGLLFLVTMLQPFLMLTLYSAVGIVAALQGKYVATILQQIYAVKQFLNDEYNEDIFQHDKNDVMEEIRDFLSQVQADYAGDIDAKTFTPPKDKLAAIDQKAERDIADADATIAVKLQALEFQKQAAAEKLAEYEKAIEARKQAAQNARGKYLNTFEWKNAWYDTLFLDVNSEDKIIACPWTRQNTLYYSRNIDMLQQFSQLAIFQNVMHVNPTFANQVVLDHKYMGGNLQPFTRLPAIVIDVCVEPEKIANKMASINVDVRARCNNILQSCASIEDFNELMSTYDATGESYVTVHVFGLSSFSQEMRLIMKNGPKVGYYMKIYMTTDELSAQAKDFPFDDVPELVEVTDKVMYRTPAQIQRILGAST